MEKPQHLLNNQIRANKILLLSEDGQKRELTYQEAMKEAYEQSLDLVQFSNNKDVAVCKILKYDSWLYHESKRRQKQDFKNRSQEIKAMNFRPGIGDNDFQIKIKKITEFLEDNHRVKIVVKLKNREFTMREINEALIQKITEATKEISAFDSKISYSPKEINFTLKPEKKVVATIKPKI